MVAAPRRLWERYGAVAGVVDDGRRVVDDEAQLVVVSAADASGRLDVAVESESLAD